MNGRRYVAVDLGAESGRVILGTVRDEHVELEEIHRFANVPVRLPDGLHWDMLHLYSQMLSGLGIVSQRHGKELAGVGVDSWAIDYALLDHRGRLLGNPYAYRDARTDGVRERVAERVSPSEQYSRTGIAQLPFNTIYQLAADRWSEDRRLELAQSLLMIPDLLHYWLTGVVCIEYTNASTTGALGVDGTWAKEILTRLEIPSHMLLDPRQPGTALGPLRSGVCEACGLGAVPVVLPATHDTASAVVAVPAAPLGVRFRPEPQMHRETSIGTGISRTPRSHILVEGTSFDTHAYISSGTWSLLGLELDRPVLSDEARLAGFTNEGGVGGTFRFLTNIMGLWLVQECRRAWARRGMGWSYDELNQRATDVASPPIVLDVDDPAFLHPVDMPVAISDRLSRTGQQSVDDPFTLVRVILEGLALKYRVALERAEQLAGVRVHTVHVVGGGARNRLLCQLTADACGRPVLAGPAEATAMGNVLIQAIGTGVLRDLGEARTVALNSAQVASYEPRQGVDWEDRQEKLLSPDSPRRHG